MDVAYHTMCQHCDDAPCIKSAKNDAVTKRDDGIVIIDPEKSKGKDTWLTHVPMDQSGGMKRNTPALAV